MDAVLAWVQKGGTLTQKVAEKLTGIIRRVLRRPEIPSTGQRGLGTAGVRGGHAADDGRVARVDAQYLRLSSPR